MSRYWYWAGSRLYWSILGFDSAARASKDPLIVIVGSSLVSIVANPVRVSQSPEVAKSLMFFLSFVLVLYVIVSVIRRLDSVDFVAKTLVVGGAILAGFAIVEARTGYNVFNHIDHVMPFLRPQAIVEPGGFLRYGSGTLRVFGSAQHPIALSAALVMLMPLAIYLAQRYRQRRWILCAIALVVACAATVSRTGIIMLIVVGVVFLILRPRETVRLWPALLIALIVIKVAMPGTLGAIRHSFFPPGGLIAEQEVQPGTIGSGRLADLGPALGVWAHNQPLTGQGSAPTSAFIPTIRTRRRRTFWTTSGSERCLPQGRWVYSGGCGSSCGQCDGSAARRAWTHRIADGYWLP